jgi:hypothetical protein
MPPLLARGVAAFSNIKPYMPDISLTDFVDFVIKAGTPKLTKVTEIKQRPDYSPAFDFWKPLRDGIRDFHKGGGTNKSDLDQVLLGINDPKKLRRYPDAIRAYKKFLSRKQFAWFDPPSQVWSHAGLNVRINPELGLEIDGQRHVIKLYFKEEAPSKSRLQVVLGLMHLSLNGSQNCANTFSILDVCNTKLTSTTSNGAVEPLLKGEASSFVAIWEAL